MNIKRKQPRTSTVLLFCFIVFLIGIYLISYNYLVAKKEKIYSSMNLLLYKEETPENIEQKEVEKEEQENQTEEPVEKEDTPVISYNYIGTLEVPRIKLERGFLSIDSPYNNVDRNITVINGSTYPNEANNNLIIAAHSGNCAICYFDKLYKLEINDKAVVTYSGYKYTYKLVSTYDVEKTGKVEIRRNMEKNTLTLITCTHNSDTKQSVYIFELDSKKKI